MESIFQSKKDKSGKKEGEPTAGTSSKRNASKQSSLLANDVFKKIDQGHPFAMASEESKQSEPVVFKSVAPNGAPYSDHDDVAMQQQLDEN
jgi:hypothetical protein